MTDFKTFLEYRHNDEVDSLAIMNPNFKNGKSPNSMDRKHLNLLPKQKPGIGVDATQASKLQTGQTLTGPSLNKVLIQYGVDFEPAGVKVLGNSYLEIEMWIDEKGRQFGRIRNRKQ